MRSRGNKQLSAFQTRIAINAHLLSPRAGYRRAGIHQYITQVLRCLPPLDEGTHYTVYTRDVDSVTESERMRVVSSRWPTDQRLVRILWEQAAWPLQAAQEGYDLLHSMAFVTPMFGQIPTVVTVYDLSFVHFPENFPAMQRRYLQSQTARSVSSARRVIAISEASRKDLHQFFDVPLKKIDVIYPGVDPQYRPLSEVSIKSFREEEGVSKPFILHVGTLQPRKNIPLLLRAFSRLRRSDIDLVLVGAKGWFYEEIFSEVEKLGLGERVHFPGYVRDEQLPFWYNAARLLVFPSVYEGFGMPIVEAMACGTPVVAAQSSSIPEAGGEVIRTYDPQDVEALTQQLTAVLDDSEVANRMSRDGAVRAAQFSWQRAGLETSRTYARALED